MRKFIFIILGLIIIVGGLWFWFVSQEGGAVAVLAKDGVILEVVKGQAQVTLGEASKILSAPASQEIDKGAKVSVLANGQANIIFSSGTTARLDQNTEIELSDYLSTGQKISIKINLINGAVWSRLQRLLDMDSDYEIKTANTVAVVRGTVFDMTFIAGKTELRVLENEVAVKAIDKETGAALAGGEALVRAGNEIQVDESHLPNVEKPIQSQPIPAEVLEKSWFQENFRQDKKINEEIKKAVGDGGVSGAQVKTIVLPQVILLDVRPTAKENLIKRTNSLETPPVATQLEKEVVAPPTQSPGLTSSPAAKTNVLPKNIKPVVSPSLKPATQSLAAKLSVTSVSPTSAPGNNYQYTKLIIKGTGFSPATQAFLGNRALTNLKVIDATTLEGTLGAGIALGRYEVVVTLGEQRAALPAAFNVFEPVQSAGQ